MCTIHVTEHELTKSPQCHVNPLPGPRWCLEDGDQKTQLPQDPGGEAGPRVGLGGGRKGHLARLPTDATAFSPLLEEPPVGPTDVHSLQGRVLVRGINLKECFVNLFRRRKAMEKPKSRPGAHPGRQSSVRKAPGRASFTLS